MCDVMKALLDISVELNPIFNFKLGTGELICY